MQTLKAVLGIAALAAIGVVTGGVRETHAGTAKLCPPSDVHAVVRGKHVCRAAPDLRVAISGAPAAVRVGGSMTYSVSVRNVGRLAAAGVVVRVSAEAELVTASSDSRACVGSGVPLRATCTVGRLRARGRAVITIAARGTSLGPLVVSARATLSARDANPRDNSTAFSTRVTEPDSVRGRGSRRLFGGTTMGLVTFEVDAISSPAGQDPAGTFSTQYGPTTDVRGTVVCLTVAGNRATVGGIVEQSNEPGFPVGSGILLAFTDGGSPGAGRDTQITYLNQPTPRSCPVPAYEGQSEIALDDGDITVADIRP